MMKFRDIQLFVCILLLVTGCNDFLSENPNRGSNEPLNSVVQIEALLNNSSLLRTYTATSAFSSDDIGYTVDLYNFSPWSFNNNVLPFYVWDIEDIQNMSSDDFWEAQYKKIFTANLIINEIDEVNDLSGNQSTDYLAEAHFLRAVAYWQLVNIYCMPYAEETKEVLGLPLKRTTSYEESLVRANLHETYSFIENDLLKALTTSKIEIDKRWRVSQPAVYAMLARLYLFTCRYAEAEVCALKALESTRVELHDYNQLGHIDYCQWNSDWTEEIIVSYSELYGYNDLLFTDYQESYYSEVYHVTNSPFLIPSDNLISIFNQEDDLRFNQFFVKNGTLELGFEGFGDDILYRKFFSPDFYCDVIPAGPTVAEMLLTLAEVKARQDDWQGGMEVINVLRQKRFNMNSETALIATSQEEAILHIIEERHREMPFMMRWFDVRRLAFNETSFDDIELERTFYGVSGLQVDYVITDFKLPAKSKRYAQPLSNTEISRSRGQLLQNLY